MKKRIYHHKIITSLIATLLVVGCAGKEEKISIITPTGAPSVAFYNYANDKYFTTNSTPSNITAMMHSGEADVIVLDLFTAVKQIEAGAKYKLAALITLGNFFIYATGNKVPTDHLIINESDKVYSFGENAVPDKTFKALFPQANIIAYAPAVAGAATVACSGKIGLDNVDYVFIAQPALQNILNNSSCLTSQQKQVFNVQSLWLQKYGSVVIPQAAIFIKDSTYEQRKNKVDQFLIDIEQDIVAGIANPNLIKDGMNQSSAPSDIFGVAPDIVKQVIENNNGLGLGYIKAADYKDQINKYFNDIGVSLVVNDDIIL